MQKLLLLAVLAFIALVSTSLAGQPRAALAAGCVGDGPESNVYSGRASGITMYQFDFCSDPTLMLSVDLQWSNGKKDLALEITDSNGTAYIADARGASEHFLARAPLAEGTWTVEVVNKGSGSVAYSLTISFVHDPNF